MLEITRFASARTSACLPAVWHCGTRYTTFRGLHELRDSSSQVTWSRAQIPLENNVAAGLALEWSWVQTLRRRPLSRSSGPCLPEPTHTLTPHVSFPQSPSWISSDVDPGLAPCSVNPTWSYGPDFLFRWLKHIVRDISEEPCAK